MDNSMFVSIAMDKAINILIESIVHGSITGELIDEYKITGPNGIITVVLVFEKHYYRAGNRLTLTVTLDNFTGKTRVHYVGGGGGEGLFRFDWGAADSFADSVNDILSKYRI